MYRALGILCLCLIFLSGCFLRKKSIENPGVEKLPSLGVTLRLPDNFQALPQEQLSNMGMLGATVLEVEPFNVIPQYAYAEQSGKGIMVVSELQFRQGIDPEKYPLDNLFMYQKNLGAFLGSDEITSQEISSANVTTVLMIMMLDEGGEDIALLKGLSFVYPNRFFMIDLYAVVDRNTVNDGSDYANTFYSLDIY